MAPYNRDCPAPQSLVGARAQTPQQGMPTNALVLVVRGDGFPLLKDALAQFLPENQQSILLLSHQSS